ncbi:MAG TPA: adenylate/guanylate cyclase domain-containing protein [Acidimicrobiia bacterium]|nr:adenylate/guanylate cyclase domain-containing protein [Acidimicrobiia bacterium]
MAPSLPSGTVTFLLTDIEGSTRLVQDLPADEWRKVLEDHNRILRAAVDVNGGITVKTEGDAFFTVFESAPQAVQAAIAMQEALQGHEWPAGSPVKVRIGIHTGEGTLGGDDYVGLDVHRAARIAAAGHGNQIVLSETTAALVERHIPEGASLRDMGKHRLKDLSHHETLFQLTVAGLQSEFPPLRTLDAVPNNLPLLVTSFVGRRRELDEVESLLETAHLITLTGPGGTGKTRLALQVGAEAVADFPDGVFFVDLAPISEAELLASEILTALGLEATQRTDPRATLLDTLRNRRVLLILDNFEQILGAAPLVGEIVTTSPGSRIVVTSRAPLRLAAERELPLSPMPLPPADEDPESLSKSDAARLFVERAMAVRPDFRLDENNASAVAQLLTLLDGLPLAIELVASRVRLLPVQAILDRLDSMMLSGGAVDLPERQRTIEAAIRWSYDLLSEPERLLFARLSVFAGGGRLEEIEEVCATGLPISVLDGLATLVDQSLVMSMDGAGDSRFRMLHVIRQFAAARLSDFGEEETIRRRHLLAYIGLTEEASHHFKCGHRNLWLDRVARDHDNVRAALDWAIGATETDLARRLSFATWRFWQARGHLHEGRRRAAAVLSLPDGEPHWRAKALEAMAGISWWAGIPGTAETYGEALEIHRAGDDDWELANALYNHALALVFDADQPDAAWAELEEAERLFEEVGDTSGLGDVEWGRGNVLGLFQGDRESALHHWERSLAYYRKAGNNFGTGWALFELGGTALRIGDADTAWRYLREGLELLSSDEDVSAAVLFIALIGGVALLLGDEMRAYRLGGAFHSLRETSGTDIVSHETNRVDDLDLDRLEALTGDAREAYLEGRNMDFAAAVAYALAGPD